MKNINYDKLNELTTKRSELAHQLEILNNPLREGFRIEISRNLVPKELLSSVSAAMAKHYTKLIEEVETEINELLNK